jgi:hypothetical protein
MRLPRKEIVSRPARPLSVSPFDGEKRRAHRDVAKPAERRAKTGKDFVHVLGFHLDTSRRRT